MAFLATCPKCDLEQTSSTVQVCERCGTHLYKQVYRVRKNAPRPPLDRKRKTLLARHRERTERQSAPSLPPVPLEPRVTVSGLYVASAQVAKLLDPLVTLNGLSWVAMKANTDYDTMHRWLNREWIPELIVDEWIAGLGLIHAFHDGTLTLVDVRD